MTLWARKFSMKQYSKHSLKNKQVLVALVCLPPNHPINSANVYYAKRISKKILDNYSETRAHEIHQRKIWRELKKLVTIHANCCRRSFHKTLEIFCCRKICFKPQLYFYTESELLVFLLFTCLYPCFRNMAGISNLCLF